MNALKEKLKNKNNLVTILLVTLLAVILFLPLVNSLGYYRDDWHVVWGAITNGTQNVVEQHQIDQ